MRSTGGAAMSERYSIHPEAKARQLNYFIGQLNTCLVDEPGDSGKPVDKTEQVYWEQMFASLYRLLDENQRQSKVRH